MPRRRLRTFSLTNNSTRLPELAGAVECLYRACGEIPLKGPNDLVIDAQGGIYFTDPPYGRVKFYGVERSQELDFQGVYRVGADPASPELLVDDFDRPKVFSLLPVGIMSRRRDR